MVSEKLTSMRGGLIASFLAGSLEILYRMRGLFGGVFNFWLLTAANAVEHLLELCASYLTAERSFGKKL